MEVKIEVKDEFGEYDQKNVENQLYTDINAGELKNEPDYVETKINLGEIKDEPDYVETKVNLGEVKDEPDYVETTSSLQKKRTRSQDNYVKEIKKMKTVKPGSEAFAFSPKSTPRKKQKISSDVVRFARIMQILNHKNDSNPKEDEDGDKLFCLSLVKEIKKVPEHKRLRTKIEMLKVIMQNQNFPQVPQHQPNNLAYYG
ncbi:uncharacterized protein LOC114333204 isoform X2 [Diabrotica virgifera virgifera]|uniref:Uncharacterized protein LOC114333204 isoform X4 n=1 Tax=Diabrotica virgifera virgifera TaxID=50390 RepID=A0A6P7FRG5_DIAVI|nr:uncharacterized protein LOC114333204 isoform X2 [Diabrotica virgifera virgifera]